LNQEIFVKPREEIGFVKETLTFIVSDDLYVMPNNVGTKLNILQKHGLNDLDAIDKQTVNISKKEACFIRLYIIFSVDYYIIFFVDL
jgi:hypothetical protein